jgi:hypothetical protein
MAITVSNRGAITERPTVAVHNIAAAVGTSTVMVPPIVTQNKHRNRHHSRRRPVSGDGSGTGITGFAPASEHKRLWRRPNARSFSIRAPTSSSHATRRGGLRRISSTDVFRVVPHAPRWSGPRHALVHRIGLTRRTSPGRGRQALLKR